MRIPRALILLLAASGVLVAACGGNGGDEGASGVVETPVASSSASPSVSPSPVVRSVSFVPVDAGMLGMHVAGAQEGDWPADSVLGPTSVWNASTLQGVQYPVPGAASVPRSFAAWDEFVTAVVDRYAGRIAAYQMFKERDPAALVVGASPTVRMRPARAFVEIG